MSVMRTISLPRGDSTPAVAADWLAVAGGALRSRIAEPHVTFGDCGFNLASAVDFKKSHHHLCTLSAFFTP